MELKTFFITFEGFFEYEFLLMRNFFQEYIEMELKIFFIIFEEFFE